MAVIPKLCYPLETLLYDVGWVSAISVLRIGKLLLRKFNSLPKTIILGSCTKEI